MPEHNTRTSGQAPAEKVATDFLKHTRELAYGWMVDEREELLRKELILKINEVLTEERAQHSKMAAAILAITRRDPGFANDILCNKKVASEDGNEYWLEGWLVESAERYNSVKKAGGKT